MASRNFDGAAGSNPDGFMPHKPRDEPLETGGHKPGVKVGNDAVPEFHATPVPTGTAPASRLFKPQNDNEVPPADSEADAKGPSASDTLTGATSGDVHTGIGHPGQGQSSAELHHDGTSTRKNVGASLEGRGAEHVENDQ